MTGKIEPKAGGEKGGCPKTQAAYDHPFSAVGKKVFIRKMFPKGIVR